MHHYTKASRAVSHTLDKIDIPLPLSERDPELHRVLKDVIGNREAPMEQSLDRLNRAVAAWHAGSTGAR